MMSQEQLVQIFVQVADTLAHPFDLGGFLHSLAGHAARVTGRPAVGLTLTTPEGELRTSATENQVMALELSQVDYAEGPGVDAGRTGQPAISADLRRANGRWPHFAPTAVEAGMLAVHTFPMRLREQVIGAIDTFSATPGHMSQSVSTAMQGLADLATIGLLQEASISKAEVINEQLQYALSNRIVIEQAKGALAFTLGVGVDEAFDLMRRHARSHSLKLTDLARLVLTHPTGVPGLQRE